MSKIAFLVSGERMFKKIYRYRKYYCSWDNNFKCFGKSKRVDWWRSKSNTNKISSEPLTTGHYLSLTS